MFSVIICYLRKPLQIFQLYPDMQTYLLQFADCSYSTKISNLEAKVLNCLNIPYLTMLGKPLK